MGGDRFRSGFAAALIAITFAAGSSYAGSTIFVNDDAPAGGNGQTWATAYQYLQDALTAARNSGGAITEIWVAAGTYKPDRSAASPDGTRDRLATFQLVDGVGLRGGFAGTENPSTFNLADRDLRTNKTLLSGDLAGNDVPDFSQHWENSFHVIVAAGCGAATSVDGFTVASGCANDHSPEGNSGGAIYVATGSPTLLNCTFCTSQAFYGGGIAIGLGGGAPTLINCAVYGNFAFTFGGAMHNYGTPILINCTVAGNSGRFSNSHGGIYGYSSNVVTLTNCIVWDNVGVQMTGSATVTHSCIQGGWAGAGNLNVNPRLMCVARGNLALRRGSPCIDAGDSGAVPPGVAVDRAGRPRVVDDPDTPNTGTLGGALGAVVDIGAYEYQPAAAKRLYVNADAVAGGDGQSWATAYQHLQDGLTRAAWDPAVTEIWVSAGVYRPDRDSDHPDGSGSRTATFQLIDCMSVYGGYPGLPGQENDFSVRDPGSHVSLLTGDLAADDVPGFENNAENSIHVVTAERLSSAAILDGFTVSAGNANGDSQARSSGAGLHSTGSSMILRNCTFSKNSAGYNGWGAGVCDSEGQLRLTSCTFIGNTSVGSFGGGMYSSQSSPTLIGCAFIGNSAVRGGGFCGGDSTLINCRFSGNSSQLHYDGSGVAIFGGTSTLTNCTIAGNLTEGGVFVSSANVTMTNCIVWGNVGSQIVNAGSTVVTYSCVQGGYAGTGNIQIDPRLLADGRLRRGSPCIDAGNSVVVPTGTITDLSGNPRFGDDPETPDTGNAGDPPEPVVDMGAYEYQPVPARRVYVNAGAPHGGSGQDWATAYRHIQDALAAAQADPGVMEIWVAGGLYKPDRNAAYPAGNGDRMATFELPGGVHVYGGFPGQPGQENDFTSRDPAWYQTVLSGDLAGDDGPNFTNNSENSNHVVRATRVTSETLFDGFIISGGNANGTFVDAYGGGMCNVGGSPVIANCIFSGNTAPGGDNGPMHYFGFGAGLYSSEGSPTLINCAFVGNVAPDSGRGGGMCNSGGSPTLASCSFTGNRASTGGGFYSSNNGGPTFTGCLFQDNWSYSGAGLSSMEGNLVLTNCAFSGNSASYSSGSVGGGLYSGAGNLTVTNCTFAGNSALSGGGVYGNSGNLTLTNCILWGNGASQVYGSATITYSCVQGGWAGTGNISVDPRLMSVGAGRLGLRRGSPCVDAGNSAAVPPGLTADLAGNLRFVDDPDTPDTGDPGSPPGPVVDMGAYEYGPVAAKRLYVKAGATPGGDGQSWAAAYLHLQDALETAQVDPAVTEVWVAGGAYRPDRDAAHPGGTGDRRATFRLAGGVGLYGGFPGQAGQEGDFAVRNPNTYLTVLSGDLAGDDGPGSANNGENSFHVLTASGVGSATVLSGFTISGGNANGNSPDDIGGGLLGTLADLNLVACRFSGNSAATYGGGMASFSGRPVLTNCVFSGNAADAAGGGGLYVSSGNPVLNNCVFSGNTTGATGLGGGMYSFYSYPRLANCTFSGNSASNGGGLFSANSSPSLFNCIVWGNGGSSISGSATVLYSCVQGGWPAPGNINSDPLFVDAANGDLRLRAGSPCIDAGRNASVPAAVTTDLDDLSRFVNDPATPDCRHAPGTCGTAPIVDMGPYEFHESVPGDFDYDGDVDKDDLALFRPCMSGTGVPIGASCRSRDLDHDDDVDQSDFGVFQRCLSGPDVLADPNCGN